MKTWLAMLLLVSVAQAAEPTPAQIREAASRAISLLQDGQNTWYSHTTCHSCHHQFLPAIAFRTARAHGVPLNEDIAHADAVKAYAFTDLDAAVQYRNVEETTMDLGFSLVAADATGLEPNLAMQAYARLVAGRQEPAGYWDDLHQRPPQSYSNFTQTAIGMRAIQLYSHPSQKADVARRVALARAWMIGHQPRNTEERVWKIQALKWAGSPDRKIIDQTARDLAASQLPDGGWNSLDGRASDAYSTGEALAALSTSDPAWKRGLNYLLSTQKEDGSWHVESRLHPPAQLSPPYFESGYPYAHDQYLSATASSYAIMAFSMALGPQSNAQPTKWKQSLPAPEPWAETVLFGSVDDVKKLLDSGFDPNSATKGGTTALMMAVPDVPKMKLLIERGANVNARAASKYSALMIASVYRESADAVRLLLANHADITGTPSPLLLAAGVGDSDVLSLLHKSGATIDRSLSAAVRNGKSSSVPILLDEGSKVDEPDANDITPLGRAVLANEVEIARQLLKHGAEVNRVGRDGMTPLLYAASIDYGDSEMINLLLSSGAQLSARNKEGLSALDLAKKYNHTHLISALMTPRR